MSLFLAVIAAFLLGSSDFCAARASRTAKSFSVTRTAVLTSAVLAPIALWIKPSSWALRDVIIAAVAGVLMLSALALLYRGYSVAPMGIVGPTASVLIAGVPLTLDVILDGLRPGPWAWVGIALGLLALGLTSYSPGGSGSARAGFLFGIAAGFLFGFAFFALSKNSDEAGLMPVVVQRIAGILFLSALQPLVDHEPLLVKTKPGREWAVAAGAVACAAMITLQLAFQRGSAGPVSVAASQFASVAVLLSVAFNKERLKSYQWAGVAASAIGVALMSAG